ncbi:MAG: hypothetical protein A3B37_02195 [Candidatus Sungbacteria bacterium RIFCSPLOWO2_01_FULL_59_16]|uniref:GtrA/DPMS transmembrane domain-containing protein n=1 Tax=Candidatus Sungbacteria bacterium RIFCSPLOWO2_01_FULL_59_16 TaxID=1802280 RepID=A0A1G2LD09_9BACT|nr:MAG: hypothetical protein A3B37_02195 [Candidatus Sungbacteria bacterium RIFCSPLOWO2_01_FULL_59_16]
MPIITRRDYLTAFVVGVLTALFAVPTFVNVGLGTAPILAGLFVGIPILWVAGVWLGGFLGRWLPFFVQFGKFATTGFLSASIDFGVLNILSRWSGITAGLIVGGVNVPGFGLAVSNSYLWNRLWVFRQAPVEGVFRDFPKFLTVTVSGLLLNSGIVVFITTYVPPQFGTGPEAWLNIAKIAASAVILIWNFIGYKMFVFR